jgi:hypothetical protein
MSLRANGSYIGYNRVTTTAQDSASGIWSLAAAERRQRAGAWPSSNLDPYFANVSLLLHMDGSSGSTTFTDSSGTPKTVTAGGGAAISTSQSKFGGASLSLDGAGDFLGVDYSQFNFLPSLSSGWTVECWIRPTNFSDYRMILQHGYNSNYNYASCNIYTIVTSGALNCDILSESGSQVLTITSPVGLSLNTWQHVAISYDKTSETLRMFIDGALVASGQKPSGGVWGYRTDGMRIGNYADNGNAATRGVAGFIDEFRITAATRYTANFTPPTAAFPDTGP